MKMVESGMSKLQVFLDGAPDPKAHFGSVLTRLEQLTQKIKFDELPIAIQAKLPFLQEVVPELYAIKRAWRDKVMHIDGKIVPTGTFAEEKAIQIHDMGQSRRELGRIEEGA
jgi:hypothetical protein